MALKAVLFDWGDTIMRVFPGSSGPMAEWPRVEIVDGADAVLNELKGRFSIALLTNATDSEKSQVVDALARVRLERAFDHIFTARDLGHRKPDPMFFRAALERMDIDPEDAVMIGDDFDKDVIGAKMAGLKTIWFNPDGGIMPVERLRFTDAVTGELKEIPRLLRVISNDHQE